MTTQKILGNEVSAQIMEEVRLDVEKLKSERGVQAQVALVMVEGDPASQVYLESAKKSALKIGIAVLERRFPATITTETLVASIKVISADESVHAILCQLPLPSHLDEAKVIEAIAPSKDVDCVHPYNQGLLAMGGEKARFFPCTPFGVCELLKRYGYSVSGKQVVVLGRSSIVGRPLSIMLSTKGSDATVTLCHSRTQDLQSVCRSADFLFAAIGKPKFVTRDFVKEGAVVVDVGTNRILGDDGKYLLVGDVDFQSIVGHASAATPVPGGVGPMTRAMLMKNIFSAASL
ncbi:MAG: bifunctional 5,10-methylenetetrahydrofolate dehydrogenase/5,10-methenyltetrahydrofolate cyclohydrolase [Oligoflexia bacterium]|nr:bifunctional 5,10-methylenetetrahydrofolate dehydrogenase/5,10-methenyltetrahydrofolate cyclohydrolase [Oligoflexia bacterium]MBF0363925.1 bifunctional 5,10-methylenetetrahydrofolate dehydrogenase/5,10-methenyltetrahydrofolate cyclohydrolase [Oligoflexia bacterium]